MREKRNNGFRKFDFFGSRMKDPHGLSYIKNINYLTEFEKERVVIKKGFKFASKDEEEEKVKNTRGIRSKKEFLQYKRALLISSNKGKKEPFMNSSSEEAEKYLTCKEMLPLYLDERYGGSGQAQRIWKLSEESDGESEPSSPSDRDGFGFEQSEQSEQSENDTSEEAETLDDLSDNEDAQDEESASNCEMQDHDLRGQYTSAAEDIEARLHKLEKAYLHEMYRYELHQIPANVRVDQWKKEQSRRQQTFFKQLERKRLSKKDSQQTEELLESYSRKFDRAGEDRHDETNSQNVIPLYKNKCFCPERNKRQECFKGTWKEVNAFRYGENVKHKSKGSRFLKKDKPDVYQASKPAAYIGKSGRTVTINEQKFPPKQKAPRVPYTSKYKRRIAELIRLVGYDGQVPSWQAEYLDFIQNDGRRDHYKYLKPDKEKQEELELAEPSTTGVTERESEAVDADLKEESSQKPMAMTEEEMKWRLSKLKFNTKKLKVMTKRIPPSEIVKQPFGKKRRKNMPTEAELFLNRNKKKKTVVVEESSSYCSELGFVDLFGSEGESSDEENFYVAPVKLKPYKPLEVEQEEQEAAEDIDSSEDEEVEAKAQAEDPAINDFELKEWTAETGVERNYNRCRQNRLKRSHFNQKLFDDGENEEEIEAPNIVAVVPSQDELRSGPRIEIDRPNNLDYHVYGQTTFKGSNYHSETSHKKTRARNVRWSNDTYSSVGLNIESYKLLMRSRFDRRKEKNESHRLRHSRKVQIKKELKVIRKNKKAFGLFVPARLKKIYHGYRQRPVAGQVDTRKLMKQLYGDLELLQGL